MKPVPACTQGGTRQEDQAGLPVAAGFAALVHLLVPQGKLPDPLRGPGREAVAVAGNFGIRTVNGLGDGWDVPPLHAPADAAEAVSRGEQAQAPGGEPIQAPPGGQPNRCAHRTAPPASWAPPALQAVRQHPAERPEGELAQEADAPRPTSGQAGPDLASAKAPGEPGAPAAPSLPPGSIPAVLQVSSRPTVAPVAAGPPVPGPQGQVDAGVAVRAPTSSHHPRAHVAEVSARAVGREEPGTEPRVWEPPDVREAPQRPEQKAQQDAFSEAPGDPAEGAPFRALGLQASTRVEVERGAPRAAPVEELQANSDRHLEPVRATVAQPPSSPAEVLLAHAKPAAQPELAGGDGGGHGKPTEPPRRGRVSKPDGPVPQPAGTPQPLRARQDPTPEAASSGRASQPELRPQVEVTSRRLRLEVQDVRGDPVRVEVRAQSENVWARVEGGPEVAHVLRGEAHGLQHALAERGLLLAGLEVDTLPRGRTHRPAEDPPLAPPSRHRPQRTVTAVQGAVGAVDYVV